MGRLEEVNKRIAARLRELEDDRAARTAAHAVVLRKDARLEDLEKELDGARRRLRRRRETVKQVKQDLAEAEAASPDEDTEEEADLRARLDQLAGEVDEAIAVRDRLLGRIDRVSARRAEAVAARTDAAEESRETFEALERLRDRRKRILERQDRPSPNFSWAEFDCNDGTRLPEASKPAVKDWCQRIGEPLRQQFGTVTINSAFRHRAYNARIGGEDASVHIYDYPGRDFKAVAVDFRCARGTPRDWSNFTAGRADGRGLYSTFHHADTRNRIGWSDASWVG